MRKLLLISSVNTGHGHKSIAKCLTEELDKIPDIEYRVVDGFDFMGKTGRYLFEDSYGPMIRYTQKLYSAGYKMIEHYPQISNVSVRACCETRFMKMMREFHPDLILTVHPVFVGSMESILHHAGICIPYVVHQADFENISSTWFDKRSDLNITLTDEAYEYTLSQGIPADKVMKNRFPVRPQVQAAARLLREDGAPAIRTVMLMSGAEGSGKLVQAVKVLLSETDKRLIVVAGRNNALVKDLERISSRWADRIEICGFVPDIERKMAEADVMVMRASPNSVMEACAMGRPIIAFDALPGQEAGNPDFVVRHGLGVLERDADKLPGVLARLEADGGAEMKRIKAAQAAYFDPDSALRTIRAVDQMMTHQDYEVPHPFHRHTIRRVAAQKARSLWKRKND